MPTLSIPREYTNGAALTEAHIDAICDEVETFFNTTGIDADNIQDASITSALIAASAVTEAKIATSAVTESVINDAAVTNAKRVALNYTLSSAVDSTATTGTYGPTVSTTAQITTNGRPIVCCVVPTGSTGSYISVTADSGVTDRGATLFVNLKRGSTVITCTVANNEKSYSTTSTSVTYKFPTGCLFKTDAPVAGTYTYTVEFVAGEDSVMGGNATSITVKNVKLLVYEL